MYASNSSSFQQLNQQMTVDYWMKAASWTNNKDVVIFSKTGTVGNYGWMVKMSNLGSKVYLILQASLNGTTYETQAKSQGCTKDTNTFHHYAITFNKGAVKFFCDGVAAGSATIGSAGWSTLHSNTADFQIGRQPDMSNDIYLDGILDEVRFSQVIRYSASFSVPTQAYSNPD